MSEPRKLLSTIIQARKDKYSMFSLLYGWNPEEVEYSEAENKMVANVGWMDVVQRMQNFI